MFLAERAGFPVVAKLARNRIDLGKAARSIVPKGAWGGRGTAHYGARGSRGPTHEGCGRRESGPIFRVASGPLIELGLSEDTRPGAPICRWRFDDMIIHIMPTRGEILGFSSQWYPLAFESARPHVLPDGTTIRLVTLPSGSGINVSVSTGGISTSFFSIKAVSVLGEICLRSGRDNGPLRRANARAMATESGAVRDPTSCSVPPDNTAQAEAVFDVSGFSAANLRHSPESMCTCPGYAVIATTTSAPSVVRPCNRRMPLWTSCPRSGADSDNPDPSWRTARTSACLSRPWAAHRPGRARAGP